MISMRLFIDGAFSGSYYGSSASEALQSAVRAARVLVGPQRPCVAVRDCLGGLRAEVWHDPDLGILTRRTP